MSAVTAVVLELSPGVPAQELNVVASAARAGIGTWPSHQQRGRC